MDKEKKPRPRSKAYPAIALGEALKKTEKINENLGLNGEFNRETIAAGMGYLSLSGTASRTIAALVHYGLLSRKKDQYALSDLAKQYLTPVEDHSVDNAIKEAALSPNLFAEIYEKFAGQILPRQFMNRLINEFGIQQKAASDVERIFKSTMETASILGSNGILATQEATKTTEEKQFASTTTESTGNNYSDPSNDSTPPPQTQQYQEIFLRSGVKVSFPIELSLYLAMGEFAEALKALDHSTSSVTDDDTEQPADDGE